MLPEPSALKKTPELSACYGTPLLWLVMLTIAGALIHDFRRRGWF